MLDRFLLGKRYLILDSDTIFTSQFTRILEDGGVKVVRTSLHAPNMNSIAERFVLTAKTECLNKVILFGYAHLERCLAEFAAYYRHHPQRKTPRGYQPRGVLVRYYQRLWLPSGVVNANSVRESARSQVGLPQCDRVFGRDSYRIVNLTAFVC